MMGKEHPHNQRELRVLGQLVVEGTPRGRVLAAMQERIRLKRLRIPMTMTKAQWVKVCFRWWGSKVSDERNEALLLWEVMKPR